MQSTSRAEAERLLGIAEKLLQNKDLNGCRDFALLAQETEPLLDGSDQILAIVDVLIASDKKINNHIDWYAILQLDSRRNEDDVIKRQYRRLALLLHPDKNKYPFADVAFKFVADAWALLSDRTRCCLRCANCRRAFQAVEIPVNSLPPVIPGKEAYYCCWSYFPMGFAMANSDTAKTLTVPNTMPTMFPTNAKAWPAPENLPSGGSVPLADPAEAFAAPTPPPVAKPKPATQKTPTAIPTPPTAGGTVPRKRDFRVEAFDPVGNCDIIVAIFWDFHL
ncbi:DnaJ domain-containing protein [Artemisia annua]|uniref:DnaJ domain-containing protein n=1 Tax=Artemisia annua TaxID=35608 RepID=A0A2U1PAH3_ARTAN|nr:DnaJ domain-containing protein [Artemisia annua]